MSYAKRGIKALGLCLVAALSVMAVMAVGAQATVLEEGNAIAANLAFTIIKDSSTYLVHGEAIGGTKLTMHCTTLSGSGTMTPVATTIATSISWTGCTTLLNGTESMVCLPKEPITAKAKGEVYLHKGEETVLLSPEVSGTPFTIVKFDKEAGCSIGPNFELKGSAIILECKKALLVDQKQHLFEQVTGTSHDLPNFSNSMTLGTKGAQILGSFSIEFNTGKTWAVHI